MHFDDRLATVLRMSAGSERAARTQFRQILDLVGSAPRNADEVLIYHALEVLDRMSADIPLTDRIDMVRDPALRIRSPYLVSWLGRQEPQVAQHAMARARLGEEDWLELIPSLPIPSRSLLRHRESLPASVKGLLARLGIQDLVLPEPIGSVATTVEATHGEDVLELDTIAQVYEFPAIDEAKAASKIEESEISALMRRIDDYQRERKARGEQQGNPRLPLGDKPNREPKEHLSFDFSTNVEGRIDWASHSLAQMLVGIALPGNREDSVAHCCKQTTLALRLRQPVRGGTVTLEGAPAIAGEWRIDAAPQFAVADGSFTGFRGRMRRRVAQGDQVREVRNREAELMRQILHELRTPVNAIQGFAEVIQQQIFGPAPNEYRALAAAIGVDIARIQAGFDELDRLAKLEMGAMMIEPGAADFHAISEETVRRLQGALRSRSAGFQFVAEDESVPVAVDDTDLQQLVWRVLASMAASASPGELIEVSLRSQEGKAHLIIELPASLEDCDDLFGHVEIGGAKAVTAGMFGLGFTMRLARAEARAARGELLRSSNAVTLTLPLAGE